MYIIDLPEYCTLTLTFISFVKGQQQQTSKKWNQPSNVMRLIPEIRIRWINFGIISHSGMTTWNCRNRFCHFQFTAVHHPRLKINTFIPKIRQNERLMWCYVKPLRIFIDYYIIAATWTRYSTQTTKLCWWSIS